ncbi:MAG TPA: prolipoprotein diacylglyceryl transferase family protein [Vicinamibacterales bacterium]|nr:prolipoprotein diacylglyceryl transferase family protein [Vicinamibacterales bacterium]
MSFPVYLRVGTLVLHPHQVFETLAWAVGFFAYFRARQRTGDVVSPEHRLWVLVAAVLGGLAGSRVLYLLESTGTFARHVTDTGVLFGGKSIVGGLLGGVVAVEITKKWLGVRVATGDLLVVPLVIGMAIGRVGCFLTGLADQTYGIATTLPWGIDFGDGVARHPTQLYEWLVLAGLAVLLGRYGRRRPTGGDRFKLFMVTYLAFRLGIDLLKPGLPVFGLTVIQWACVAGLAYYAPHMPRLVSGERHE